MSLFQIHPQLLADSHRLGRFELCHVLLHRNATIPWFILVPESGVGDLLDLPDEVRNQAVGEAAQTASFIKQHFACAKINFAAIGNIVPQLHLHVVGRKTDDPCWPGPVWGVTLPVRAYSANELAAIDETLRRDYGLNGATDGN